MFEFQIPNCLWMFLMPRLWLQSSTSQITLDPFSIKQHRKRLMNCQIAFIPNPINWVTNGIMFNCYHDVYRTLYLGWWEFSVNWALCSQNLAKKCCWTCPQTNILSVIMLGFTVSLYFWSKIVIKFWYNEIQIEQMISHSP